jgi:ribosomal protein S18 acetylase RimI-like enzyme
MLIRKAGKKDLIQCENLVRIPEMRLATGGFFDRFFLEKYLDENYFLVAEDEGSVVGLIFGEPVKANGAIIWMIAVDEKIRGKGIGSRLLKAFEKKVKKIGIQWIVLYGYQKNPKVLKFYRKHKFCEGVKNVEFVKDIS